MRYCRVFPNCLPMTARLPIFRKKSGSSVTSTQQELSWPIESMPLVRETDSLSTRRTTSCMSKDKRLGLRNQVLLVSYSSW